jgi:hypothetical protein
MEQDDLSRTARAAGLDRYLNENPEQLRAALRSAADLAKRLPKDLLPAEEPAHVFGAGPSREDWK